MTQRVEARFHCDGMDLDENRMGELQMSAMCYAGANAHFTEATPNGSIEMAIDGEKTLAAHYFKPGKVYRVIFEELTDEEDDRERELADGSWPNVEELAALLEEEKYEDLRELADRFGKDEAFLADWHKTVETLVERDIALMTEAEFNMVRDFFLQNANESKKVTILIGIPGSGKSTWAAKQPGATVVNADRYHIGADGVYRYSVANAGKAHLWCYRAFLDALERRDEHIIVDNTNTQNWERSPYVKHAQLCGYTVEFKRFRCPVELAAKRNVHGVAPEIIEKMAARIEEPPARWGEVEEIEEVG